MNEKACKVFRKVIDGLTKDRVKIAAASVTPVSLKGFLFYKGVYEIEVSEAPKIKVSVISKFTYKKPSKKKVKATKKKVYKRDEKGRFV